ncbi:MAG: autoinducer binding domain-containing protein, partial [Hyphomicrobiales bacterium]|nr:autoinducer binding domain-containing protein [Hyphomicrobiales bacterium]
MDRIFRTFIDSLNSNADVPALRTAMTEIAAALDLGTFAYLFAGSQSDAEVKLISNYPTAWTSHYLANGYEEIDPVIDRVVRTREPFQWGCECWSHQICDPQFQLLEDAAHF